MNQQLSVVVCVIAFGLTFAAGFAFLRTQEAEDPRPQANQKPAPEAVDKPEPKKEPEAPKQEQEVAKPAPAKDPAARPTLISNWTGAAPPAEKGENEPSYELYYARELSVDWTGARVLTATYLEAICWDSASGLPLQKFKVATRTVPRKPPDKPELHIDQEVRVSPGARTVAMIDKNGKSVTLHDAVSGARLGTFRAPKDRDRYMDHHPPEFSVGGDFLLFSIKSADNRDQVCSVTAANAQAGVLDLRRPKNESSFMWRVLIGMPRAATLIRHAYSDDVRVLDLSTAKERVLKSVTVKPFSLFQTRGIKMSPNGRYLSARGIGRVQVVDWQNDRLLMSTSGDISNEWFTPDGTRLVVGKDTDWIQYRGGERLTPIGGWLELWDVERGTKLADFRQDKVGLRQGYVALGFSGDGTKFALGDRKNGVALIDFEKAFGVPPLPPVPAPQEKESWR